MIHSNKRISNKKNPDVKTPAGTSSISKKLSFIFWLLFACMNLSAFIFSSHPAELSSTESSFLSKIVVQGWNQIFDLSLDASSRLVLETAIETPLRKAAHFTEYAFMGSFAFLGCFFRHSGLRRRFFLISWAAVILSAAIDEIHQLFVPGRSGELRDVILDSCGGITGIFLTFSLICLVCFLRKKQLFTPR